MTIKSAPSGTCFLYNIRDLDILTSMSRVLVTIAIGDKTVYSEFLYPADGEIVLADLADIFQPYARQQLVIDAVIILLAGKLLNGFQVNGFWWALLFSIIVSIVTNLLNNLFY